MITISDNTATNALLRLVGFERLRRDMEAMGLSATRFERCYFDDEAQARGLSNYVCPGEIGMLLEQIYRRSFCCEAVSAHAEEILLLQQIRHKIPGYIDQGEKIANKTGESGKVTHDGAIVFAEKPFVLVICSEDTDVPETERFIREIALELLSGKQCRINGSLRDSLPNEANNIMRINELLDRQSACCSYETVNKKNKQKRKGLGNWIKKEI